MSLDLKPKYELNLNSTIAWFTALIREPLENQLRQEKKNYYHITYIDYYQL